MWNAPSAPPATNRVAATAWGCVRAGGCVRAEDAVICRCLSCWWAGAHCLLLLWMLLLLRMLYVLLLLYPLPLLLLVVVEHALTICLWCWSRPLIGSCIWPLAPGRARLRLAVSGLCAAI